MYEVFVFRGGRSESPNNSFVLPPGCEEFAIGRQNCDYCLTDPSISRKHSTLRIDDLGNVVVTDHSKFGTLVNGKKLTSKQSKILYVGDSVQFANHQIRFQLNKESLKVCTSNLPRPERQLFKEFCSKAGIEIQSEVEESTHFLVMPKVTATVKVFASLMLSRIIITPTFFMENQNNLNKAKTSDFEPPVVEPIVTKSLCNLKISPIRVTIFKDMSFLFLDETHYSRMRKIFMFAGAKAVLYSHLSLQEKRLILDDLKSYIVLVQTEMALTQSELVTLQAKMNEINMRPISDCEFGLSILYCNKTDYCNPFRAIPKELEFLSTQALRMKETLQNETVSQVTQKKQNVSRVPICTHDTFVETVDDYSEGHPMNVDATNIDQTRQMIRIDENKSENHQTKDSSFNANRSRKEPLLPSKEVANISRIEESQFFQHAEKTGSPRSIKNRVANKRTANDVLDISNEESIHADEAPSDNGNNLEVNCKAHPAKMAKFSTDAIIEPKIEATTESDFNFWNEDLRDSNIPDSNVDYERSDEFECHRIGAAFNESNSTLNKEQLLSKNVTEEDNNWSRKKGPNKEPVSKQAAIKEEPTELEYDDIDHAVNLPLRLSETTSSSSVQMQGSFANLINPRPAHISSSSSRTKVGPKASENNCNLRNFKRFRKVLPVIDGIQLSKEDFLPFGNSGPLVRARSCTTASSTAS